MTETLSTIASNIAGQLVRTDLLSEIKSEIKATIRDFNRRPWYLTEVRGGTFSTVASTAFYSTVDFTSGSTFGDSGDFTSSTSVKDIVSIKYARVDQDGLDEPLKKIRYRDFEAYREGSQALGFPDYFCLHSGQIGLWPTPTGVSTVYVTALVKGVVPADDADGSVWFDEAQELVEAGAAKRVCLKYITDVERANIFAGIETDQIRKLDAESARKTGTGRVVPTNY